MTLNYYFRQIQASKLLSDNHYLNKYPRLYDSTFTGRFLFYKKFAD